MSDERTEWERDARWLQRTHPDLASEAGIQQFCERVAILMVENRGLSETEARQLAIDGIRNRI